MQEERNSCYIYETTIEWFEWEWLKSLPIKAKLMKIIKLIKIMKFILKYTEQVIHKLFMMILTNYHDIWSYLVLCGHRKSLETTHNG